MRDRTGQTPMVQAARPRRGADQREGFEGPPGRGLVGEYYRTVMRYKRAIAGCAVAGMGLALLSGLGAQPVYRARTSLNIQNLNGEFMNRKQIDPTSGADATTEENVQTQIKLLQSETVLETTVDRLKHEGHAAGVAKADWLSRARRMLHLGGGGEIAYGTLVDEAAQQVKVKPMGMTHLVEVTCDSRSAEFAAKFCNTLREEYQNADLNTRGAETQRTGDWLNRQVAEMKGKVEETQSALEKATGGQRTGAEPGQHDGGRGPAEAVAGGAGAGAGGPDAEGGGVAGGVDGCSGDGSDGDGQHELPGVPDEAGGPERAGSGAGSTADGGEPEGDAPAGGDSRGRGGDGGGDDGERGKDAERVGRGAAPGAAAGDVVPGADGRGFGGFGEDVAGVSAAQGAGERPDAVPDAAAAIEGGRAGLCDDDEHGARGGCGAGSAYAVCAAADEDGGCGADGGDAVRAGAGVLQGPPCAVVPGAGRCGAGAACTGAWSDSVGAGGGGGRGRCPAVRGP